MSKKYNAVPPLLVALGIVLIVAGAISSLHFSVLEPQGIIAAKERNLIIFTVLLSLVVVIPVFTMLFIFAWKYREGNTKAKYKPDSDHSRLLESIWWGIPLVIITIISVVTWKSSHDLDPFKSLESDVAPMTIQVVSLQWKWLFIYPEQNIATVNYVQFPANTPIDFEITSDAPMNSFWIPSLGGQIYAMSGMNTHLHLMADRLGSYRGSSANISGDGFAGMKFAAQSTSETDFNSWVQNAKKSSKKLDLAAYDNLSAPSKNNPIAYYSSFQNDLFNTIMMKYMDSNQTSHMHSSYNAGSQ